MFGKNKIVHQREIIDNTKIYIKDIFFTLQGEAIFSGYPAIFVRLGYCNLQCHFCDTDFETDLEYLSVPDVYERILDANRLCKFVVITGGEPLLQPKIKELTVLLLSKNYTVQFETSGSIYVDLPYEHKNLYIICSPKTGKLNPKLEPYINAYKYIIKEKNYSDEDGLPIYSTQIIDKFQKLARPYSEDSLVYLSPMDEYQDYQNKKNMIATRDLCLKYGYKLSLQIHKIVGVD
jgi:organic radical activating enzyme